MILLYIILSSIILYWAASYLEILSHLKFKISFFVAFKTILSYGIFIYIVSSVSTLGSILGVFFLPYFIKYFYKLDIKKSIKLWLFYLLFLLPFLITIATIISIPDIVRIVQDSDTQYEDSSVEYYVDHKTFERLE